MHNVLIASGDLALYMYKQKIEAELRFSDTQSMKWGRWLCRRPVPLPPPP